jgi:hypothetical protein
MGFLDQWLIQAMFFVSRGKGTVGALPIAEIAECQLPNQMPPSMGNRQWTVDN